MRRIKHLIGLCIYKIAPIKKNRYVFTSFSGHYSDHTKHISIKLHEMDPSAEIIWLVSDAYRKELPDYVKAVNINSLKSYWYRGTAMTQIDNVYGFRALFKMHEGKLNDLKLKLMAFLSKKKKQPIFTTMHATPLKRLGRDQIGNTVLDMLCSDTYLMVGDSFSAEIFERVTFGKIPVEVLGAPRDDILFKDNPGLKKELGLPEDKKIVMYAPTFRNDGKDVEGKNIRRSGIDQLSMMDFDVLFDTLSQKFGGEWALVCRFHYHVADMVDWEDLATRYPGRIINGNAHDDMADYLACTDVLITDSSSSMFDFCVTDKPCFLFFPDLDNYRSKERGFYLDIEKLPFPVSLDFDGLMKDIREHNKDSYVEGVDKLLDRLGVVNKGTAAEHIVNYIKGKCNK